MNGYDQVSTATRRGRKTVVEASGDSRSDGSASQTRDGNNRYDTSTPEKRRKALASARRSGNPADEAQVRKQINQEANSTIDALMLGLTMDSKLAMARRDNRARRQGGYRQPALVTEVKDKKSLPPWLQGDDGSDSPGEGSSGRPGRRGRRGRVAESALNPQIKFRETVNWNTVEEVKGENLPPWLRKDDEDDMDEVALNADRRNDLPSSDFAGPDRSYPIDTEARARSAISRVKANGSPDLQRRVIAAVKRRYPDMDVEATASK